MASVPREFVHHRQLHQLQEGGSYLKSFAYSLSRFQSNRDRLVRAGNEAEIREYLEPLYESAYKVGIQDNKSSACDILFPHRDLSRMFYATARICERSHLNYNAHIVLHTEPSHWLRLSYHLGCTPSPTEVSPTFSPYYRSAQLDPPFNSFEFGIPAQRIMQDALEHSDLAYEHAGDLNWDNGLGMLSDSLRSKYEDDSRDADKERQAIFEQSFIHKIW